MFLERPYGHPLHRSSHTSRQQMVPRDDRATTGPSSGRVLFSPGLFRAGFSLILSVKKPAFYSAACYSRRKHISAVQIARFIYHFGVGYMVWAIVQVKGTLDGHPFSHLFPVHFSYVYLGYHYSRSTSPQPAFTSSPGRCHGYLRISLGSAALYLRLPWIFGDFHAYVLSDAFLHRQRLMLSASVLSLHAQTCILYVKRCLSPLVSLFFPILSLRGQKTEGFSGK